MEQTIPGVAHWSYDATLNCYSGTSECYRLRNLKTQEERVPCTEHTWWHSVHHADRDRLNSELLKLFDVVVDVS